MSIKIKSTKTYDLEFSSKGPHCKLHCTGYDLTYFGDIYMDIPLNLQEAVRLRDALNEWIEKKKEAYDASES